MQRKPPARGVLFDLAETLPPDLTWEQCTPNSAPPWPWAGLLENEHALEFCPFKRSELVGPGEQTRKWAPKTHSRGENITKRKETRKAREWKGGRLVVPPRVILRASVQHTAWLTSTSPCVSDSWTLHLAGALLFLTEPHAQAKAYKLRYMSSNASPLTSQLYVIGLLIHSVLEVKRYRLLTREKRFFGDL